MDKIQTGKIVTLFTATLPNLDLTPEKAKALVEVWHAVLSEIPFDVAQAAALMLLRSRTISVMPQPGEVYQAALSMRKLTEPTALEAWGEVSRAFQDWGQHEEMQALASMSPRTAYVVQRMGWFDMCMSDADKTSVLRGQFCKLYEASQEREADLSLLPLAVRGRVQGGDSLSLALPSGSEREDDAT